ncbi:MAG TPA: putative toxin-antitoxin system toxin component, PIN family [Longimicrobium sp.]
MRILLDTNVLISAFISRGLCSRLLEHCAENHTLVTSEPIVEELREKMLRKFRMSPPAVERAIGTLFDGMEVIAPAPLETSVSRDPDDDVILASALAGACEIIISGDADLLDLTVYEGISILSPRHFWDLDANPQG